MARSLYVAGAEAPVETAPKRLRYPCKAHQCPMAGTIFTGGDGICGYHFGANGGEFTRITQILLDWQCITDAINRARSVSCSPALCADVKAQNEALRDAWATLAPLVEHGWKLRVQPRKSEYLGDWGRRLEVFLGARIKESLTGQSVDETAPTPVVAAMRKELRSSPLKGNAGDFL